MKSFLECVEDAYTTHWAGTKDGERSRDRARSFMEVVNVNMPARSMSAGLVRIAISALQERGRSNGTVNRHLAAFSTVWRLAHQNGHHPAPPPEGLYLPEGAGRTRTITETELGGLCAELPPAHGPLAVFLWETGCRVGEALRLRPADLDLARRVVSFRDTKNGADRSVPLTTRARLILAPPPTLEGAPKGQYPHPGRFAHLSQSAFNHAWSTARERMGLQDDAEFVPHALRHSAITRWVVAGIPLPVVAKMAGHRSLKTTMRYTHVSTTDCAAAMERAGIL